jgi:hypothetical protein
MAFMMQRKPFKIANSRALVLPISWCNFYRNRIDKVTVIEDEILLVVPAGLEGKAQAMINKVKEETNE